MAASPRVSYTPAKVSPIFTDDNPNTVTIQCEFDVTESNFFVLRWYTGTPIQLATRSKSSFSVEPAFTSRITENTWNLAPTIPSTHKIDFKVTLFDQDIYQCRVTDMNGMPDVSPLEPLLFDGKVFPV